MPEVPSHRRSLPSVPKPSPPRRRVYGAASHSPSPSASPTLSSRSLSRSVELAPHENVAANIARPSAPAHPVDPPNLTGHLVVDAEPNDLFNPPDSPQSQQSLYKNAGIFSQARDFTVTGTFVDASNVTYNTTFSNQFMKELLGKTIPGAEFDSSDRDPPPRCQPGTRLAVLERCLHFISSCNGVKRICWVVGVAGVGKSAIMQSVAESPKLPVSCPASVFFSIKGRNDGTKAIITLSYQFAAKSDSYRQVIEQEITRDPSLLRSSMAKQFNKLIVEPFIHNAELNSAGRVLVIIDGLDECEDRWTQQELLRLISDICLTYPSSPLVWLIASRPEPHITSFFSKPNVIPAYEKEEIPIDSDQARADVERFLREKLTEIQEESDSLNPQWPEEHDIWQLASAAGGLFAYAHTVVRYIGDSRIGSPVSQLSDVLHVIDNHPITNLSREEHPMALLDALYDQILSKVPHKIMNNTRKLLLALASDWNSVFQFRVEGNFIVLCNWLGMTPDEAYAAIHHLHSILHVPRRDKVHEDQLKAFHKSFFDYISDFSRSGFSLDIREEARQLKAQCTFRILNEVPGGINLGKYEIGFYCGNLASSSVARDKISLTWPVEDYGRTRFRVYKLAIDAVVNGMRCGDPIFQSGSCIRFLTTVFVNYFHTFPSYELLNVVFDESRRLEFIGGILKQIPLEAIAVSELYSFLDVKLRFRCPATTVTNLADPWNSSCEHNREGEWEAGNVRGWVTTFGGGGWMTTFGGEGPPNWTTALSCAFCFERLKRQLKLWKGHSPDTTALVLFTSTDKCCVEVRLVDPEDGMSEWIYWFWCKISREERIKYGSAV